MNFLFKVFSIIISITVIVSLVDYLADNKIKLFLFSDTARDIFSRFTGLNGEPRAFGKTCSLAALFLISFLPKFNKDKKILGIVLSFIGIVISFSASAYIATVIWVSVLVASILFINKKRIKYLIVFFPIALFVVFYLNSNSFYMSETSKKMEKVVSIVDSGNNFYFEKIDSKEPKILSHFEVFDRAALNFLYRNPFYGLIGTGPNLISIPASPYLTRAAFAIYGDRIDSTPHAFFVNILARSGIIGLFLWLLFCRRFTKSIDASNKDQKMFFVTLFIFNLVVSSNLFYFFIGVLLGMKSKINLCAYVNRSGGPTLESQPPTSLCEK